MTVVARPRLRREDLKPGQSLCDHCTAKCCKYYGRQIDAPEDREDLDTVRWYVLHGESCIFTEDESWYLLIHMQCKHLQPDHRCGIYETRPNICSDYSTDDCEYEDHYVYDRYFETSEQIAEYTEALFSGDDLETFRSPKPALLPILN